MQNSATFFRVYQSAFRLRKRLLIAKIHVGIYGKIKSDSGMVINLVDVDKLFSDFLDSHRLRSEVRILSVEDFLQSLFRYFSKRVSIKSIKFHIEEERFYWICFLKNKIFKVVKVYYRDKVIQFSEPKNEKIIQFSSLDSKVKIPNKFPTETEMIKILSKNKIIISAKILPEEKEFIFSKILE